MKYKFNEEELIEQFKEYIDKTYSEHYTPNSPEDIQTFELISKNPDRGLVFSLMSIIKYADRYGIKEGENRKDIMKILHFALLALYNYDRKNK